MYLLTKNSLVDIRADRTESWQEFTNIYTETNSKNKRKDCRIRVSQPVAFSNANLIFLDFSESIK
jgi:hypothetical protein